MIFKFSGANWFIFNLLKIISWPELIKSNQISTFWTTKVITFDIISRNYVHCHFRTITIIKKVFNRNERFEWRNWECLNSMAFEEELHENLNYRLKTSFQVFLILKFWNLLESLIVWIEWNRTDFIWKFEIMTHWS